VKLSILELGYRLPGDVPGATVRRIAATAPVLERLGFQRLWFAEHHADQHVYATPEPLVAHAAAITTRLRVGPAGILMNVHTPVRVAEVFRTLEALYPGRIDLGVAGGRLLPSHEAAYGAASEEVMRSGLYGRRVEQLVAHLRGEPGEGPLGGPDVQPHGVEGPVVVCLGAGRGRGNVAIAAKLGLPFCYSLFHTGPDDARNAIAEYRAAFRPSRWLARPHALVAVNMLCGATNNDAVAALYRARMHSPGFRPAILGRPALCREQIEKLLAEKDADELVIASSYQDVAERIDAYHLLAEACGLGS
jgi:luciferase family oxidoreductase group 1